MTSAASSNDHLTIVLDVSRSMLNMQDAAYSGVAELATVAKETVTIHHFNDKVTLGEPQDAAAFDAHSITKRAEGTTALYDAIVAVVEYELARDVAGMRTIVILTDGMNTAGQATALDAAQAIERSRAAQIEVKYIGSNQSLAYATSMGVRQGDALLYEPTSDGMFRGLAAVRRAVSQRSSDGSSSSFTVAERAASLPAPDNSEHTRHVDVVAPPLITRQHSVVWRPDLRA